MSELQVRVVSATVLIAASILGYLYLSEFLLITILSVVWLLMLHELFRHMNSLGKTVSGILWISCFIFFAFSGHMLSTKIPTFLYILYFFFNYNSILVFYIYLNLDSFNLDDIFYDRSSGSSTLLKSIKIKSNSFNFFNNKFNNLTILIQVKKYVSFT